MGVVKSIPFETPDGVERKLRFSTGSRQRIREIFGSPDIRTVLNKQDAGAVPGLLFACMYDEEGNPPADLTVPKLAEMLPGDEADEQLAAFLECMSQGRRSKKEYLVMIREALNEALAEATGTRGSSTIGPSVPIPEDSDSQTETSGGDSQKPNSKLELIPTSTESAPPTTAPESSPQPSQT